MDGDIPAEPKLDTFTLLLPLPYRVAILIVLGISSIQLSLRATS